MHSISCFEETRRRAAANQTRHTTPIHTEINKANNARTSTTNYYLPLTAPAKLLYQNICEKGRTL
jgi:hypothetical protein